MSTRRLAWVDYAKGVGILLVVIGHTLRGLEGTPVIVPGWRVVDFWIYAFHMPLFFFLSGLFLESSLRVSYGEFIDNKLRRILWPYFVWSLVQESFRLLAGSDALPVNRFWTFIYQPVMQFWFLYVLFLLLAGWGAFRKAGVRWEILAVGLLALNLSLGWGVDYGPWGVIYQLWIYGPYLALGVLASARVKDLSLEKPSSLTLASGCLGGFGLVTLLVLCRDFVLPWAILIAAMAGIVGSVCLSVLASRTRGSLWLEKLGVLSMEIFVAHTMFSSALRQVLIKVGILSPWIHVAGGIFAGILGPVILVGLFRKLHLMFLFGLPGRSRRNA